MQKAIENYIDIQIDKKVPLDEIGFEIDKVGEAAIRKARKKQRIQWRKLNK